ncbi:von Willebrand factor type A domain-containing protein [Xylaria arbuscula]|nr:von Willebrand factor type A domain-containing protein [Xylaria arbuscula]
MSIFSAGIVWDPREPLPHGYTVTTPPTVLTTANRHLFQLPVAAQPPVHNKILPSTTIEEVGRNVLPAVSVSVEARITGDVAEVTARHLFWNDADFPIRQGSYTFALPNGCTVTAFTCRIGRNKVLHAAARPKAEAQMEFQQALASHATAALLEQNTPEIFTSSLGNIPPNTRVKTEITYATILQRRFGRDANTTTLIVPTYIASRYGQRPSNLQGHNLDTKPGDISLRIEILESEHIQSIRSLSHEILVERGREIGQAIKWDQLGNSPSDTNQETAVITLKEASSWTETDFIISIDTMRNKGNGGPEAWLEIHPSFESQAAMMLTLPPRMLPIQNETSKTGEIILVADRSGSMEDKMGNLKSAMHFFLKGIPLGRNFNVWSFGSHHAPLWPVSREYNEESLGSALNYVDTEFYANMGGTEILPALEAAIASRDPSLPCDVIILTDGEVWRLDETLSLVRRAKESSNGAIRFFSLGLGAHVSHALVEGIAQQGGGYSEVIPKADTNGWDERLVAILNAALTIHVNNLRLELGGLAAMASPENLYSLNPFQAHRVFLLLEKGVILDNDSITLYFASDTTRTRLDVSIIRLESPGTLIHSLSAKALLNDLERETSSRTVYQSGTYQDTRGKGAYTQHPAEKIACKYTLLSKWTSLLLVEKDSAALESQLKAQTINSITIFHNGDQHFIRGRGIGPCFSSGPWGVGVKRDHLPFDYSPKTKQGLECGLPAGQALRSSAQDDRYENESAKKGFISFILSKQAFDGSIRSGVLDEVPEVADNIISTLKSWLCEKMKLEDQVLGLVANTALVVQILELDYKDHQDLWIMIREKAHEYINLQMHLSDLKAEFLEYSQQMLEQLDERVRLKLGRTSSSPIRNDTERRRLNDEDLSDSCRVLVHRAPIDD